MHIYVMLHFIRRNDQNLKMLKHKTNNYEIQYQDIKYICDTISRQICQLLVVSIYVVDVHKQ